MKKIPNLSTRKLIKRLLKNDFNYAQIRGKGSHVALIRIDSEGRKFLIIIPFRKSLKSGTLLSIIKQSGLSRENFVEIITKKKT